MQKINLFFILAFKEQTYIYDKKIKNINKSLEKNKKIMDTTLTWHYVMLSKYFNLYNFYEYEDKIKKFENAVIYHLPYGRDNIDTGVEKKLLKFKGKIPIVMRNYDAHSPIKLSQNYLNTYHDLALTYLTELVNNKNRLFTQISYDNFLVKTYNTTPKNRKFACIILRKENREGYFEDSKNFQDIMIQKTYNLREEYAKYLQIDVYGRNWPVKMKNFKGMLPYSKKHLIQNLYKFNFIIENAIVDNYLSEKILDTFLSLSVPVYIGSPIIQKYIPKKCFVDIRDFKDNNELINYLENMKEKEYNEYINNILKYRDEIFDRFSTKNNFVKQVYKWYNENYKNLEYSIDEFDKIENEIKNINFIGVKNIDNLKYFYVKMKLFLERLI